MNKDKTTTIGVGVLLVYPLFMGVIEWLGGPGLLAIAFLLSTVVAFFSGLVWLVMRLWS